MSNSQNGPENASRLQHVYTSYFNGLILGDATELSWVSAQLYGQNGYLAQRVLSHADDLSETVRINGGRFGQDEIEEALCDGIRAYEYSDATFNPQLVKLAVQRYDLDGLWLMDTVRPSNWVLKNVVEARTKDERKLYRQKGMMALGSLGLNRRFRRSRSYRLD